jgi:hypothetical protein
LKRGGNVFIERVSIVERCALGQFTGRLHELIGHYQNSV